MNTENTQANQTTEVTEHDQPYEDYSKFSLVKKLSRITSEMKKVPKNGFNKSGGYPYATDGDVFNAVNKACEAYDVFLSWDNKLETVQITEFKTSTGNTWLRYRFDSALTIMDGDSDKEIVTNWPCIANDQSDKGIGKALTLGLKYALKTTFKIDTGEVDPDSDAPPEPQQRQNNQRNNNNNRQNNQRPPQQQQQQRQNNQRQQPPAQQSTQDEPKAPAEIPADMQGRSFATLTKAHQKAVVRIYRWLGVDIKKAAFGAHMMAINAVSAGLSMPDGPPQWWDGFEIEKLEEWLTVKTEEARRKRMEGKITDIVRLSGWKGASKWTAEDLDASLMAAANALGINIEDAPTGWAGYTEEQIDQVLAIMNGTKNPGE